MVAFWIPLVSPNSSWLPRYCYSGPLGSFWLLLASRPGLVFPLIYNIFYIFLYISFESPLYSFTFPLFLIFQPYLRVPLPF